MVNDVYVDVDENGGVDNQGQYQEQATPAPDISRNHLSLFMIMMMAIMAIMVMVVMMMVVMVVMAMMVMMVMMIRSRATPALLFLPHRTLLKEGARPVVSTENHSLCFVIL